MKLATLAVVSLLSLSALTTGCASTASPRVVNHARLDSRSDVTELGEPVQTPAKYHPTRAYAAPSVGVF